MGSQVHRQKDKEQAAELAGLMLNSLLAENNKQPALLLLAAGSAFEILKEVEPENLKDNLTITMLDERYSEEKEVNNFMQLQSTDFYVAAEKNDCNFIRTAIRPNENKQDFAKRWENGLKEWRDKNSKGKIIATVGMGPDGHIAGVFPYPGDKKNFEKLFLSEAWVTAYSATGKHKYEERVTTTLTFFKEIDEAVVFICGDDKKPKFDEFIAKQGKAHELPALGIYNIKNVEIFTDIK